MTPRGFESGRFRFLLLPLFLVVLAAAASGQPAELYFDPDDGSFGCVDSMVVEVMIDATATDVRGLSLTFEFDPDIIRLTAVRAGALLQDAACDHFVHVFPRVITDDSAVVDAAALGCSVAGTGSLLRLVFVGESQGISDLRCLGGELRDGANQHVDFVCLDTTVDSICPIAVVPFDWGRMKRMYR